MKKLHVLDIYVIFSIAALVIYTIVSQLIIIKTGMQLDTLTTCFFACFGGVRGSPLWVLYLLRLVVECFALVLPLILLFNLKVIF